MNDTITDDIRQQADSAVLCWLATTGKDGAPNVSPKEAWLINETGQVVIAEIASAQSLRNVRACPSVCVAFLDVFTQKGYQLYGRARIVERDAPSFARVGRRLIDWAEPKFIVRNLFLVDVDRARPIVAPSYGISPAPSETDMTEESYRTYGVRPAPTVG